MQRNWDTIRKILLAVEALPDESSHLESDKVSGVIPEVAAYHIRIMRDAGLIVGGCREAVGPTWCYASGLTWQGHELLDSIRSESVWNKIKTTAMEKGVSLTISTLTEIARLVVGSML